MKDHLETIRGACIKSQSDKDFVFYEGTNGPVYEPIRLADVLLAINSSIIKRPHGGSNEMSAAWVQTVAYWNLRKDDLSLQSPETLEFLVGLLKD